MCYFTPKKQTNKKGRLSDSFLYWGRSVNPNVFTSLFSLKGNIVVSTTYYGNIKYFVHRLRVNCIMLGKKVQNKWDLFLFSRCDSQITSKNIIYQVFFVRFNFYSGRLATHTLHYCACSAPKFCLILFHCFYKRRFNPQISIENIQQMCLKMF